MSENLHQEEGPEKISLAEVKETIHSFLESEAKRYKKLLDLGRENLELLMDADEDSDDGTDEDIARFPLTSIKDADVDLKLTLRDLQESRDGSLWEPEKLAIFYHNLDTNLILLDTEIAHQTVINPNFSTTPEGMELIDLKEKMKKVIDTIEGSEVFPNFPPHR